MKQDFRALFLIIILVTYSCNIPRDPENSWENIKSDGLNVGVIINPPYTFQKNSTFAGSEIELIKNFAKHHDIQITYESGNETDLIEKLENYEIDILLGGFTEKSIWTKKVGLTTPYDKEYHVLLIPKGENKYLHFLESFIFNHKRI